MRQRALVEYPGSIVALCGRRFGKTDGLTQRPYYWMRRDPGLYWWVGLSWRSASLKRAWREVVGIALQILRAMGLNPRDHINRSEREIRLPGLGEIWFRTAENPPSLAGEGVKGVILDEYTLMREIVWTEYVQGTLLDYEGWAVFAGVPKGHNWGSSLWRSAVDKEDWLQIHATTYDNPHIPKKSIEKVKNDPNTPELFFRQEYLAEIISGEGIVFRNVNQCATAVDLDRPEDGAHYVAGVDVASLDDFTVVSVFDATKKEQVFMDRFNRVEYPVLEDRLVATYERFGLRSMTVESNSIGRPVIDHLRARGLTVSEFATTGKTKEPLIKNLQAAFEHGTIKILNHPILIGELLAYEGKRRANGWSFGAPSGMHDDTVMSLAIGWDSVNNRKGARLLW